MKQDAKTGKRRGRKAISETEAILRVRMSDIQMVRLQHLAQCLKAQEGVNITISHLARVAISQFLNRYSDLATGDGQFAKPKCTDYHL